MHRALLGVIVTGAVTIAGIGFAGSYTAVRELALDNGFGNFSYLFPLGIDAGICVALALDLLLTWIRIPLPLLRHTAWLLTAATIIFNAATAWPDPLGTGMHAVIPVLFVVTVEAARHATGRMADITAGRHMDGIRPIRWLLSPLPTLLLWRRMKLWEIRSYQRVITLEQQRLTYQARLRSQYGRAWRHKAPVELLLPLRLTRYGIPLPTSPTPHPPTGPATADTETPTSSKNPSPPPAAAAAVPAEHHTGEPSPDREAPQAHHAGKPNPDTEPAQMHPADEAKPETETARTLLGTEPAPSRKPPHGLRGKTALRPAALGKEPAGERTTGLSTVDRYYLAWTDLHSGHGDQTLTSTQTAEKLSAHLAAKGIHGRNGKPVSPATLRRYLLPFRIYTLWAKQRHHTETPSPETIAHQCATHGITAQYNKPITPHHITHLTPGFERRWQTLNPHHPETETTTTPTQTTD